MVSFLATLDCFPCFSISLSVVVLVALRWLEGVEGVRVKCKTKNSENPISARGLKLRIVLPTLHCSPLYIRIHYALNSNYFHYPLHLPEN